MRPWRGLGAASTEMRLSIIHRSIHPSIDAPTPPLPPPPATNGHKWPPSPHRNVPPERRSRTDPFQLTFRRIPVFGLRVPLLAPRGPRGREGPRSRTVRFDPLPFRDITHFRGHRLEQISGLHTMPCHAMPRHVMSCHVISCHVMPCHAMPCHIMSCHAMPRHAMPCHAKPCHAMSCRVMPCHVMTMSCHAMSYHVMSCHGMSSCHVMRLEQIAALHTRIASASPAAPAQVARASAASVASERSAQSKALGWKYLEQARHVGGRRERERERAQARAQA